jgi:trk system potassium uptake protein TrkH
MAALVFWVLLIVSFVYKSSPEKGIESAFRESLFQVVSIVTTTGYSTADFMGWGTFVVFIFFLMLFSGASAGSTSGGMKIVRIVLLMKNGLLEFKRRLHPNAVVQVHLNGESVPSKIIYNVMAFFFTYLFFFVAGSLALAFMEVDFITSVSAVATSITNVGPGLASVGPAGNFAHLPMAAKWLLSFLMLLGRLEIFTIAILFTPFFWRKN